MSPQGSPRSVVKGLLRGERPARPLLTPLTFALAARLENLPLASFAVNPTKIVNALRQIRANLKLDGVTCYFDPFLEAEALGGKVEWGPEGPRLAANSQFSDIDALRAEFGGDEHILTNGRIPVAAEVLKRLRIMLKDEPALMARVTGPLRLAAQLSETSNEDPPTETLEFAAEITAVVAKHFVESGADMIFLVESLPPAANADAWEKWRGLLEPVINVVRFYAALPVLLLDETVGVLQVSQVLNQNWECTACVPARVVTELSASSTTHGVGMALSSTLFDAPEDNAREIAQVCGVVEQVRPVFLTTVTDLPLNADIRQVARLLDQFRNILSSPAEGLSKTQVTQIHL